MGCMLTSSQSTPKLKDGMNSNELELNLNFGEGITPEGVRSFVAQCLSLCSLVLSLVRENVTPVSSPFARRLRWMGWISKPFTPLEK
jgi:hypothetical protein